MPDQPFVITPELRARVEEALLQRGKWKKVGGQPQIEFNCLAPDHEDRHPSAHYKPSAGVWVCRSCGAGGGTIDLARRLGIDFKPLLPGPGRRARPKVEPGQQPVAVYTYSGPGGLYEKRRYEFPDVLSPKGKPEKNFQWHPAFPEGTTVADMNLFWALDPVQHPDLPVVFVEGEEVVKALADVGVLACTTGGGAGQRAFGQCLDEIRGRAIWLSPDNDRVGNEFMEALAAELRQRNIAQKLKWVRVALGEGEDLKDYIARGGRPEDIFRDASDPTVAFHGPDHITVTIPWASHIVAFDCTGIRRSRDSLNCKLAATILTRAEESTYHQRVNLLSATGRSGLRLEMGRFFGTEKDFNWSWVINELCTLVERAYIGQENGVDLYVVEETPEREVWLIPGLLPKNQPSMFFGDGESLKTMLALYCGVTLAYEYPFLEKTPISDGGRTLYVDYENMTDRGLRRRVRRITNGIGFDLGPDVFRYWNGRGLALTDQIDLLQQEVVRNNVQLVIFDSVAPALGGADPNDPAAVNAFFDCLSSLNVTTLLIAHVSHQSERDRTPAHNRKPYGSVMWHNRARRIYFFERGDAVIQRDRVELAMINTKVNEGARDMPLALEVNFYGSDGEITFEQADWANVDKALDRLRPWVLRLTDALRPGALLAGDIANRLGTSTDTALRHLKAYPDRFVLNHGDDGKGYWGLRLVS